MPDRPVVTADALAAWCTRWLGAPPAAELFQVGNLSAVTGLRLKDGREVVIKIRPAAPRLIACALVHRALWTAGFPCPEPLADPQPLNGYLATAESFIQPTTEPPEPSGPPEQQQSQHADQAAQSAIALARLVSLAPDPGQLPSLAPSPSWTAWDHDEPGLWPKPENLDVDLNSGPGPPWLDRLAAAVRDRLRARPAGRPVIGHGDWHPENLHWQGQRLIAVHDWDSVICQPEPAIAGLGAASFLGLGYESGTASVDDSIAFLAAYQQARDQRWTPAENEAAWAAGLWQRAFDAKTSALDGAPEQVLTRAEARDRLQLAGLDPDLA